MGKSNMQRLGQTLADRMRQTSNAAIRTTIELGKVNANLSITTDTLRANIPKGDYMVNLALTSGGRTGSAYVDGGSHSHDLPGEFRGLRPGDRILVAWCGFEPVVIAIIVSS